MMITPLRPTGVKNVYQQTLHVKVELAAQDGGLYHIITDVSPYVNDVLQWYRIKNKSVPSFSITYDEDRCLFVLSYIGLSLKSCQKKIASPCEEEDYNLFLEDYFYPFCVMGFLQ